MTKNDLSGYWRITQADNWDQDALDLVTEAYLSFWGAVVRWP